MGSLPAMFVISLPDSPRQAAFRAHARSIGLEPELSPGVQPAGDSPWSPHYDDAGRRRLFGYPMQRGEVGCFLAHRNVWSTMVERRLPVALVLEDDAVLAGSRLAEVVSAAEAILGRPLVARLVSEPRPAIRIWRELGGGACLGLPVRPGNLTTAYLITLEAAGALLTASERFRFPVDDFMNHTYRHGVDILHLEPELARHDAVRSEIGVRLKPPVTPWVRLRREWFRVGRSVRGGLGRLAGRLRLGLLLTRASPPRRG